MTKEELEAAVKAANTPGKIIPANVSQTRKFHCDPPLEIGKMGPGMPVTNLVVNIEKGEKAFNLFLCYMTDETEGPDGIGGGGFRQVAEAKKRHFAGLYEPANTPLYTFNVHDWPICTTAEIVELRKMHTDAWKKKHEAKPDA